MFACEKYFAQKRTLISRLHRIIQWTIGLLRTSIPVNLTFLCHSTATHTYKLISPNVNGLDKQIADVGQEGVHMKYGGYIANCEVCICTSSTLAGRFSPCLHNLVHYFAIFADVFLRLCVIRVKLFFFSLADMQKSEQEQRLDHCAGKYYQGGKYAFKADQWIAFEDAYMIRDKATFVVDQNEFGATVYSVENDDISNVTRGNNRCWKLCIPFYSAQSRQCKDTRAFGLPIPWKKRNFSSSSHGLALFCQNFTLFFRVFDNKRWKCSIWKNKIKTAP